VCLLVKDVERKELLNLDNEEVPRNPIFGDGTLLYRSIDCLQYQIAITQHKYSVDRYSHFLAQLLQLRSNCSRKSELNLDWNNL
jgi:hypothetical protein